jgi:hypothetical protein
MRKDNYGGRYGIFSYGSTGHRWVARRFQLLVSLEPYHRGVYVNFLMEEGEERIRQAYGAKKYDRLKALKRRYHPGNLFRLNQNISPDVTV